MTTDPSKLRLGIPKGSLQDPTVDLFYRSGYRINVSSRSYYPEIDDPGMSAMMFRSQEMSRYVEDGVIDFGICGHDWVVENNSDVHEVCELEYSRATSNPIRWVLAVPEESDIHKPEDLAGGIIATELKQTVKRYFEGKNIPIKKIEFSWGATEVKARLIDGIVDCTETGSSLRANKLRVLDTLLTSTTRMIANHDAWADPAKREKIEDIALLLQGAISAKSQVGLKLNVPRAKLDAVLAQMPSAQSPTVNELADKDWVAVEVIVDRTVERELVPKLSRAGGQAIFSYPLNKIIP
ncbi:ATP phosphoribosyltransferase [Algisphaera agarilytica]|uniref:ATP phosphoribosyltransferase n=1 Tax=Algisphaera agarilytica TaxID=1385975 RepID=A0A7X0H3K6_9BACT|nr:ATP phosphoribosyltransferase [Algisphaera agarilytica]MBB6428648.1 ATP phosphoribosyltransferase [Algisphaera agarilytica]